MDTKTTTTLTITPSAAVKLRELAAQEPVPDKTALRLEVQPGGCAGFKYGMFFDDEFAENDVVEESSGIRIVVDHMSKPHLEGVVIDWAETLTQSGFVINNPQAQGRCACGDSFH